MPAADAVGSHVVVHQHAGTGRGLRVRVADVRVNGRHPWKVDYTYWTSESGATRASDTFWGERPAVEIGESVVVLYDPERPTESALWPFCDESAN